MNQPNVPTLPKVEPNIGGGGGRFINAEVEALKNQLEEARIKRLQDAAGYQKEPTPIMERESSDGEASEQPISTNIVIDSKGGKTPPQVGKIKSGSQVNKHILTGSVASRPSDSMQGYSDFNSK